MNESIRKLLAIPLVSPKEVRRMLGMPDLGVGDRLMTPFGIANVLEVDVQSDLLKTDLGTWELGEVRASKYDPDKWDPLTWLSTPGWEVRTTSDVLKRTCDCGCSDCSYMWSRNKLTRVAVPIQHSLDTGACRCPGRDCLCLGHPLDEASH